MTQHTNGVVISLGLVRKLRELNFQNSLTGALKLTHDAFDYLDGDGIREYDRLYPLSANSFSRESGRLTARVMKLTSYLLAVRSLQEGLISGEEFLNERGRMKMDTPEVITAYLGVLPERMKSLRDRSLELRTSVDKLDQSMMAHFNSVQKKAG